MLCRIACTMDCFVDAIASFISYYEMVLETRSKFVPKTVPQYNWTRAIGSKTDPVSHPTLKMVKNGTGVFQSAIVV